MNKINRDFISSKSNKELIDDTSYYQKKHDAIPRRMQETRISSFKRLQAHIDEHQKRLLMGLI